MVRIGYVKGTDVKRLAERCDKKHKELLDKWGSYTFDDLCMLFAMGDEDQAVYYALSLGMMDEGICERIK